MQPDPQILPDIVRSLLSRKPSFQIIPLLQIVFSIILMKTKLLLCYGTEISLQDWVPELNNVDDLDL